MSSGSCRDKRLVKSSREEKREEKKKKRWCITVLPNRQHQLPAPGAIGMVNRRPTTTDLKEVRLGVDVHAAHTGRHGAYREHVFRRAHQSTCRQ